jgi:hypothetical protein
MSESFEEIKLRWMKSVDMHTTLDQYSLARFIHKELEKKLADANALINETQLYYMEQVKRVEDVQQRLINMYEKEKRDLEKKLADAVGALKQSCYCSFVRSGALCYACDCLKRLEEK